MKIVVFGPDRRVRAAGFVRSSTMAFGIRVRVDSARFFRRGPFSKEFLSMLKAHASWVAFGAVVLAACGGDDKKAVAPGATQCPPGQYFDGQFCQIQGGAPTAAPAATAAVPGAAPTAVPPPIPVQEDEAQELEGLGRQIGRSPPAPFYRYLAEQAYL